MKDKRKTKKKMVRRKQYIRRIKRAKRYDLDNQLYLQRSNSEPIYSQGTTVEVQSVLSMDNSSHSGYMSHPFSVLDGFSYNGPTKFDPQKQQREIDKGVDGYYVCPIYNEQSNGHHPLLPQLQPLDLFLEDLENSEQHKDSFNQNDGSSADIENYDASAHDGSINFDGDANDSDDDESEISFDDEALMEQHHDLFSENSHNEFNEQDSPELIYNIEDQSFSETDSESEENATKVCQSCQNSAIQSEMQEDEDDESNNSMEVESVSSSQELERYSINQKMNGYYSLQDHSSHQDDLE